MRHAAGRRARRAGAGDGYSDALYGYYVLIDGTATERDYFYAHMEAPTPLAEGERVRTGERIGAVGKTGNARNEFCQLHFELWPHGYHDGVPATRSGAAGLGLLLLAPGSLAAMSTEIAAEETRRYGRSAGLLTLALRLGRRCSPTPSSRVSSHTLDSDEYGTIVVLWSVDFVVAATLFRPIEQLLSRTLAEHEQLGEGTGHVLRIAALIQGGSTLLAVVVLLALREHDHRAPARRQRRPLLGAGRRRWPGSAAPTTRAASSPAGGSSASTRRCSCSRVARG